MKLPTTSTAPSTPAEQSISTFLHVEVMHDLDDGRPTLVTATESNLGDLRETSPARALGIVADARAQLDRIERLIKEYEAVDTFRAIVAEHHLHVEEWDITNLDEKFRGKFVAFAAVTDDGLKVVVVPKGQDPIQRVNAVTDLVNNLQAQA